MRFIVFACVIAGALALRPKIQTPGNTIGLSHGNATPAITPVAHQLSKVRQELAQYEREWKAAKDSLFGVLKAVMESQNRTNNGQRFKRAAKQGSHPRPPSGPRHSTRSGKSWGPNKPATMTVNRPGGGKARAEARTTTGARSNVPRNRGKKTTMSSGAGAGKQSSAASKPKAGTQSPIGSKPKPSASKSSTSQKNPASKASGGSNNKSVKKQPSPMSNKKANLFKGSSNSAAKSFHKPPKVATRSKGSIRAKNSKGIAHSSSISPVKKKVNKGASASVKFGRGKTSPGLKSSVSRMQNHKSHSKSPTKIKHTVNTNNRSPSKTVARAVTGGGRQQKQNSPARTPIKPPRNGLTRFQQNNSPAKKTARKSEKKTALGKVLNLKAGKQAFKNRLSPGLQNSMARFKTSSRKGSKGFTSSSGGGGKTMSRLTTKLQSSPSTHKTSRSISGRGQTGWSQRKRTVPQILSVGRLRSRGHSSKSSGLNPRHRQGSFSKSRGPARQRKDLAFRRQYKRLRNRMSSRSSTQKSRILASKSVQPAPSNRIQSKSRTISLSGIAAKKVKIFSKRPSIGRTTPVRAYGTTTQNRKGMGRKPTAKSSGIIKPHRAVPKRASSSTYSQASNPPARFAPPLKQSQNVRLSPSTSQPVAGSKVSTPPVRSSLPKKQSQSAQPPPPIPQPVVQGQPDSPLQASLDKSVQEKPVKVKQPRKARTQRPKVSLKPMKPNRKNDPRSRNNSGKTRQTPQKIRAGRNNLQSTNAGPSRRQANPENLGSRPEIGKKSIPPRSLRGTRNLMNNAAALKRNRMSRNTPQRPPTPLAQVSSAERVHRSKAAGKARANAGLPKGSSSSGRAAPTGKSRAQRLNKSLLKASRQGKSGANLAKDLKHPPKAIPAATVTNDAGANKIVRNARARKGKSKGSPVSVKNNKEGANADQSARDKFQKQLLPTKDCA